MMTRLPVAGSRAKRFLPVVSTVMLGAIVASILSGCAQSATRQVALTPNRRSAQRPSAGSMPGTAGASPPANSSLVILAPKDGRTVRSSNVTVTVRIKGIKITPLGRRRRGEGVVVYELASMSRAIPRRSWTFKNVPSGAYGVYVEVVQKDGASFDPPLKKKVDINVNHP